jgi:hypothetical protein
MVVLRLRRMSWTAAFRDMALRSGGDSMKAYVMTTGVLFGLLTVAHLWRVFEEGAHLATDPWYVLITLAAATLCLWACRLLRLSTRS